tara:strand:+ start:1083 stop:1397 length:315 start_codon:yes stop_codon:yes gene_type:complete
MGSAFRGRIRRCNFPKNPKTGGNPTKENIDTNTEIERIGEWRERPPKSERFADPMAFFIQPLARKREALAREWFKVKMIVAMSAISLIDGNRAARESGSIMKPI